MIARLFLATVFAVSACAGLAQTAPPDLRFLPPDVSPRDLCHASTQTPAEQDRNGETATLTDELRISFLARDIRRLQAKNADRWFDFISQLIDRRAALDSDFAGVKETLARIDLHIAAGRTGDLARTDLVARLRAQTDDLSPGRKLRLSNLLRSGVGTERDEATADVLLVQAALEGAPQALLAIARRQIAGDAPAAWDAPLDLTVTLAFGGILGPLDADVCARAQAIAQHFLQGRLVAADAEAALAWVRFAADLGSVDAIWRVIDTELDPAQGVADAAVLKRYLDRALALGASPGTERLMAIANSGASGDVALRGLMESVARGLAAERRRSLGPLLDLGSRRDSDTDNGESPYLAYLREVSQLPDAPGFIFTERAKELRVQRGRWAAEPEAAALLQEAVRRGDGEATLELAKLLVRYRDDPQVRAWSLRLARDAVDLHGMPEAMDFLDRWHRCQRPDAPQLDRAGIWAERYAATGHARLALSAIDLVTLAPTRDPEMIARIQGQALDGRSQALADHGWRMQVGSETARRYWAARLSQSRQALEAYAKLGFELNSTPKARTEAIDLFERIYRNNGVTTALDLAIALSEYAGRVPETEQEILRLLNEAGNRGEGAAIRLLSRLRADDASPSAFHKSARETYAAFAEVIEARGDFLGLVFALPFVTDAQAKDYFDRAVSLMNCGTKDADEIGEAYALRGNAAQSLRWRAISLAMDDGHVLSKLRLSDGQMSLFAAGAAPTADLPPDAKRVGVAAARHAAFRDAPDPVRAAAVWMAAWSGDTADAAAWAMGTLRAAARDRQEAMIARAGGIPAIGVRLADAGPQAKFAFAMFLRETVPDKATLALSLRMLRSAAEMGHAEAMVELGHALGFGLGAARAPQEAETWFDRAEEAGADDVARRRALVQASLP